MDKELSSFLEQYMMENMKQFIIQQELLHKKLNKVKTKLAKSNIEKMNLSKENMYLVIENKILKKKLEIKSESELNTINFNDMDQLYVEDTTINDNYQDDALSDNMTSDNMTSDNMTSDNMTSYNIMNEININNINNIKNINSILDKFDQILNIVESQIDVNVNMDSKYESSNKLNKSSGDLLNKCKIELHHTMLNLNNHTLDPIGPSSIGPNPILLKPETTHNRKNITQSKLLSQINNLKKTDTLQIQPKPKYKSTNKISESCILNQLNKLKKVQPNIRPTHIESKKSSMYDCISDAINSRRIMNNMDASITDSLINSWME
jgi:hypothetical protein